MSKNKSRQDPSFKQGQLVLCKSVLNPAAHYEADGLKGKWSPCVQGAVALDVAEINLSPVVHQTGI